MNGKAFLDTNILIYAVDPTDRPKHRKARRRLASAFGQPRGVVSTQVLSEFFVVVTRKLAVPMPVAEARECLADLSRLQVVTITVPMIDRATHLVERSQLAFWDALIVSAATAGGCSVLWTEDLSDGQTIDGVTVRNPLVG